jgi:plasmid maintenance system antidote protein VapI
MKPKKKTTKFSRYLKREKISPSEAAAALALTRSYIHMLCSGTATPGLHTAAEIAKWTKGQVSFWDWL